MAQWEKVAEGVGIFDLHSVVGEVELTKGTQMKVTMDLKVPVGGMFNWAVADWLAQRFVPDGMVFVDAYGEGSEGVIEMEADPAWLLAVVAFIEAHWVALTIAGFALWLIISLITISVKVPPVAQIPSVAQIPFWLLAGAAIGVVGIIVLGRRKAPT